MHPLLFQESSVEVEKIEEELERTQFLQPLIKVTQFKVISCALHKMLS